MLLPLSLSWLSLSPRLSRFDGFTAFNTAPAFAVSEVVSSPSDAPVLAFEPTGAGRGAGGAFVLNLSGSLAPVLRPLPSAGRACVEPVGPPAGRPDGALAPVPDSDSGRLARVRLAAALAAAA